MDEMKSFLIKVTTILGSMINFQDSFEVEEDREAFQTPDNSESVRKKECSYRAPASEDSGGTGTLTSGKPSVQRAPKLFGSVE